jgi:hypothetical protein
VKTWRDVCPWYVLLISVSSSHVYDVHFVAIYNLTDCVITFFCLMNSEFEFYPERQIWNSCFWNLIAWFTGLRGTIEVHAVQDDPVF